MSSVDTVRALLDAACLPATEAEIRALATGFVAYRASINALYTVEAARYADPALRFRAATRSAEWDR
ncbi:hypothetical protein [Nocardia brasiliensis]|uniref:hypothetical protein n=1 Tax=Nocardia brasiliensis TaxID=37326 RepID=UPI00367185B2